ncbi:MAG: cation:proton antiporter [Clostridia bacterium]
MEYTILLELGLILFFTKLLGLVFRKLGLPQVVGFLIAGLILGPSLLGWVSPSATLKIISEIGVLLIMFSAGLGTSFKDLKESGGVAAVVAFGGVVLPLVAGFCLGAIFNGGFADLDSDKILKYSFIGIIMTATSVSITVETLRELGKLKSKAGTIILNAAIIDDIIGIVLLSIVLGFKDPHIQPVESILKIALFFIVAIGFGLGIRMIFTRLVRKFPHKRRVPIFSLAVCFIYAFVAEKGFGVADITGAYLAGIILSGLHETEYVDQKIETSAYMFFAPVFFASIGINALFRGFTLDILWFSLAFVAVAVVAKYAGCFITSRMLKNDVKNSNIIGIGMVARGEVCLIVIQKGVDSGFIPPNEIAVYMAMGVLLVIISSLIAPIFLKISYNAMDKHAIIQAKNVSSVSAQKSI